MSTSEKDTLYLEHVYQEAQGIEDKYDSVLLIPSESYDAPLITLVEGLSSLDIDIYTIKKPNINSWFTNQVIDSPEGMEFDFVLSSLHWGTRFSYYDKYNLHNYKKVFLDGSDPVGGFNWMQKHAVYSYRYAVDPPEEVKQLELSPYRWMEPIGNYRPDIVFTSQKVKDGTYYFPFGIQQVYTSWFETLGGREYDFAHIPGIGERRKSMREFLDNNDVPGNVFNDNAYGKTMVPEPIVEIASIDMDKNIHSYHRWVYRSDYIELLNNTKALIYPGVKAGHWDSKRPWEAMANGCLVLYRVDIDVSEYPLQEICPFAEYNDYEELLDKMEFLCNNPDFFEEQRKMFYEGAMKYFNSTTLARYFLWRMS